MKRAVFFDRDGVLNEAVVKEGKPYPPLELKNVKFFSGLRDKLKQLKGQGFLLIGITNQPDVSRNTASKSSIEEINKRVKEEMGLDDLRVCFHDEKDNCACRKPKSGLITGAARAWNVVLGASFMIGDRWKDIEAGKRAGCKTIFIDYGYSEKKPGNADLVVHSPDEAVDFILNNGEIK